MKFKKIQIPGFPADIMFKCPGCKRNHDVPIEGDKAWEFNGNFDSPTLKPSLLINMGKANPNVPLCHLFITDGKIQFLPDCTHALAGQTVEPEDF